jgi:hypothetical protein
MMKTKEHTSSRLPSFQSRVHSVHTTLKTACKPMASAIRLLLPTQAQEKTGGFVQKRKTPFLHERKPHAQKLLMQFLRHLPTHHPEIEVNSILLPKMKESEILQTSVERKEERMTSTASNERFHASGGVCPLTVLWEFGSLTPAGTFVIPRLREAATPLHATAGHVNEKD